MHVVLLCETFLNDNNAPLYNIPGYSFCYRNRIGSTRGGVALYVRDDLKFKLRDDIAINVDGEFESIFVEISGQGISSTIVGEIYRIPNTNEIVSIERYQTILNRIASLKLDTIIASDLNFDLLKVQDHKNTLDLFNSFISCGVLPTILRPTRICHTTSTLIDNIFTNIVNNPSKMYSCIIQTDISDHLPVLLTIGRDTKLRKTPKTFTCRPSDEQTLHKIGD